MFVLTFLPNNGKFWCTLILLCLSHNLWATQSVNITLNGLTDQTLTDNVLAYLSLEQQKQHPRLTATRIQRLHQQAPTEIKKALQPFGYYQATVSAELQPPPADSSVWQAKYTIKLGTPLKVKKVTVQINGEGQSDVAFNKLVAKFPLKAGDILNQVHYGTGKKQLVGLAEERGYFDAQFTQQQILLDEQAYTAEIILIFDTQQRYRFGEVTFQQETFREELLKRFLTFKPGDFYTAQQLLAFQNALTDSDYFDQVEVSIDRTAPTEDKRLPVLVKLAPQLRNLYSYGIGYGTDTGVRGSLGWERRYVNRRGHRLSAKTELSQIRQTATATYMIPTGQLSEDYYTLSTGYKDETTDTSSSKLFKLGLNKNQPRQLLGSRLREVIGLEYRDDNYAVGSDTGHSKLLMPNLTWSYLKADDRIYTKRGHKFQWEIRGALDNLGSNTSFIQTRLSGTVIYPLGKKGRLISRGEVGYTSVSLLKGDFHDLPPSIRFFAGGDRSVRGYDYQSLGPKNASDYVIGGKQLLVGSIEYEHRILEKWSLATFYDTGNAFNDSTEPLKQGAGIGIRWHSPVGLIRVDIAAAISEDSLPLRLHITVGPDL